jgi:putative peptide modification system cyclase
MNAISVERAPTHTNGMPTPLLRTLAVCDLVDSTALTEQLGDRAAAELMHRLDRLTRDLLYAHSGREIDKTDGFLVMFERPIQAVAFALAYQRLLRDVQESEHVPLQARIGIHVGDVVLWENTIDDVSRGAKSVEVEGLVKPIAARLMSLALPGQILLSGMAYTFALRAQGELGPERVPQWRAHGRYQFKGVAESMTVWEVGEPGIAPLHRPHYTGKAHREVPWWRRPGVLVLEITALIAAVAVPAYVFLRSPPAIAFADRDWIVVGDLNNLTGEATFNDSVQSAFRIGLEQSRYVNVLSDLKVRDTLALMQRDTKGPIDRVIGSEVAIREGARALVLPTLAEIGGRVRFSVEVIDPHTQATVYTESADGSGADSVLPSLDQVGQKLRVRLGEALEVVSKESQPLDKVSSKNLDALRAYSVAQRAYSAERFEETITLYKQALSIDPGFAFARVHLARSLYTLGKIDEAIQQLDIVAGERDRLTPREALYVDAWRLTLGGPPRLALEKLHLLATLYPDFFTGDSLYAYFSFELANRFDADVVAAAERAAVPLNPYPIANEFLLGTLYLSNEHYDRAIKTFGDIDKKTGTKHYAISLAYAAKGEFDRAQAVLEQTQPAKISGADIQRFRFMAALALDRGNQTEARKSLAEAKALAAKHVPQEVPILTGLELGLRLLMQPNELASTTLADHAADVRSVLRKASAYRPELEFQTLFSAYLAARAGQLELAKGLIADRGPDIASGDYPLLTCMLAIAQAQVLLAAGKAHEAIQVLMPAMDGNELFLAHAVLKDADVSIGDAISARAETTWLAAHRGRAYAEAAGLEPFNVALAAISQRELSNESHP